MSKALAKLDELSFPRSGEVHLERYIRYKEGGVSLQTIADEDGVSIETVKDSIRQAKQIKRMALQQKITEARINGAYQNERLRSKMRKELGPLIMTAYKRALSGTRQVVLKSELGDTIAEIDDPNLGLKAAAEVRAAISMVEKPAAPSTSIVNIQQNQNESGSSKGRSFESIMQKIRSNHKVDRVIETEASPVLPEEEEEEEWELK